MQAVCNSRGREAGPAVATTCFPSSRPRSGRTMMRCLSKVAGITLVSLCAAAVAACSSTAYRTADATATAVISAHSQKYIIQLRDAPLTTYAGGLPGLAATSPGATGGALDLNSPASRAYIAYLGAQQQKFIASMRHALGRSVTPVFSYFYALNGMAVDLTPAEATQVASLPGVMAIHKDVARKPLVPLREQHE